MEVHGFVVILAKEFFLVGDEHRASNNGWSCLLVLYDRMSLALLGSIFSSRLDLEKGKELDYADLLSSC